MIVDPIGLTISDDAKRSQFFGPAPGNLAGGAGRPLPSASSIASPYMRL
jgi:hypothetical protein